MTLKETTVSKDGMLLDILSDEDKGIRIGINRIGAEMVALSKRRDDGTWRGFLYRDGDVRLPDEGWTNHATVMGYFIHRLWKERSMYRGREIRGGNHGFIRHHVFDAPVRDREHPGSLIYRLPGTQVPGDAYPLEVGMELTYRLLDHGVRIEFAFFNDADTSAHLSFGLHPGFGVKNLDTCRVIFPPGTYRRLMAPGNFLNGEEQTLEFEGGEMPFSKSELPGSFLLDLRGVLARNFTLEDPESGRRVDLDFSEVPYLTIWSDLNPFVCIEPCWGMPDSNPQRPFEEKVGIQVIPPLGTLRRGCSIDVGFLDA